MNGWQKVKIGELCFCEKGKTGLAQATAGDYPLVTTSAERKTSKTYQFDTKAVCVPLVSSTGHGHASLNYVHYQEGKFALGTILVALIPKDEKILNAQFLHLYLSRLKDLVLVPLMSGAANVSLSISKIKTVEIPLPSINEQLKIAQLFKNLVNENNELIEEIKIQQNVLKQLKQTILQEVIEGKLTAKWREQNSNIGTAKELLEQIKNEKEKLVKDKKIKASKSLPPINEDEIPFDIPQSWEWCRLGELIHVSSGDGLISSQMIEGNVPVYGGNGVNGHHNAYNIDCETVTIGRVGAYCGVVHLTPRLAWITDNCFKVEYMKDCIYQNFLILFLKYLNLGLTSFDGAQPVISGKRVYPLLSFLPPLEEQKEIVAIIEKLFAICDELESEINRNKTAVNNLMATVLNEAFEN